MWSTFASRRSFAEVEKINLSYIAHILRLTLFVSDILEAILDGRRPAGLQLDDRFTPFLVEWKRQKERFMCLDTYKTVENAGLLRCILASIANF